MSQLICFSKKHLSVSKRLRNLTLSASDRKFVHQSNGLFAWISSTTSPNKNGPVNLGLVCSLYTQMLNVYGIFTYVYIKIIIELPNVGEIYHTLSIWDRVMVLRDWDPMGFIIIFHQHFFENVFVNFFQAQDKQIQRMTVGCMDL